MKICDPYCGSRVLDVLAEIEKPCKVSFLTQKIDNDSEFRRELSDFKREKKHIDIEVKKFSARELHDRYMITDDICWSVGTSLKDLGNKDTIITQLDEGVKQALEEVFDLRWTSASIFS